MSDGIHLRPDDRMALLRHCRGSPASAVRLRCRILLLFDAGRPWGLLATVLFTSTATINRWRRAYLRAGIDAVLAETPVRVDAGVNQADDELAGRAAVLPG